MSGYDNTSETVRSTAVTTTMTNNDYDLLVLGATGAVTVNLPAVATIQPGRFYRIYKDAAAQTITIDPFGSDTIDGAATTTLASGAAHAKGIISDGTAWYTVSAY